MRDDEEKEKEKEKGDEEEEEKEKDMEEEEEENADVLGYYRKEIRDSLPGLRGTGKLNRDAGGGHWVSIGLIY